MLICALAVKGSMTLLDAKYKTKDFILHRYNMEGQSKRPNAVKGNQFRGNQADNRFKPPSDLKQVCYQG